MLLIHDLNEILNWPEKKSSITWATVREIPNPVANGAKKAQIVFNVFDLAPCSLFEAK